MIYVLDLETNGLTLNDIEITQLAYLKIDENFEIVEEFNKYYYVENLKDSANITGLDSRKLAKLSDGEEMTLEEFKAIMEEINHGIIIGQNITYDVLVLDARCLIFGLPIYPKYPLDIINQFSPEDTYMNLKWVVDNFMMPEGRKLIESRFEGEGYHDALYDVYSVYGVIKHNDKFKMRLKNYLKSVPRRE